MAAILSRPQCVQWLCNDIRCLCVLLHSTHRCTQAFYFIHDINIHGWIDDVGSASNMIYGFAKCNHPPCQPEWFISQILLTGTVKNFDIVLQTRVASNNEMTANARFSCMTLWSNSSSVKIYFERPFSSQVPTLYKHCSLSHVGQHRDI